MTDPTPVETLEQLTARAMRLARLDDVLSHTQQDLLRISALPPAREAICIDDLLPILQQMRALGRSAQITITAATLAKFGDAIEQLPRVQL